jgi:uncharacterized protein (DUF2147 family)
MLNLMTLDIRAALSRVLIVVTLIVPLLLLSQMPRARAADGSPDGVWLTQAGDAKVQVSRCGAGLCGRVVWLREPIDPATNKPQVDDKNENPAQRHRPIIGLSLFIGMKRTAPNAWAGRIYNADDGKTYASTVTLTNAAKLDVQGCVGPLCGNEAWSRASR